MAPFYFIHRLISFLTAAGMFFIVFYVLQKWHRGAAALAPDGFTKGSSRKAEEEGLRGCEGEGGCALELSQLFLPICFLWS